MILETQDAGNGVTLAILSGRLDIAGASAIDLKFNAAAGAARKLIVDISGVSFVASIGLRTLVTGAKAISNKGGRMVLVAPQPNVEKVLRSSSIDTIIPIYPDQAAAKAALA